MILLYRRDSDAGSGCSIGTVNLGAQLDLSTIPAQERTK